MEKMIIDRGQRLPPENKKDAEAIGIQRADDVRIFVLNSIPLPTDLGLKQLVAPDCPVSRQRIRFCKRPW